MSERGAGEALRGKRVVLGVTSSIAAYKAVELTSRLRRLSAEVSVVMTPDSLEFLTPLAFETLSGNHVITDLFEEPAAPLPAHISLGKEADVVIVAPASADFIGRAAAGLADNALLGILLVTRAPVVIAPSMNEAMFLNPVVQENLDKLRHRGFSIVQPGEGRLACGGEGPGRLAPLETVLEHAAAAVGETA